MAEYFDFTDEELNALRLKDKKLSRAIDRYGHIYREIDTDLYVSVIHEIVAQLISNAALRTVWGRFLEAFPVFTPEKVYEKTADEIQALGITFKKAQYIRGFTEMILNREFDLERVRELSDDEAIRYLEKIPGIGRWTAEMLLLFSLNRKDIISFKDVAILNGLKKLYHHKEIDRTRFLKYRKRYSPYGSIASLYLWAISMDKDFDM